MCFYKSILARFPRGSVSYAFAYGSVVKQQLGYDTSSSQRLRNNIVDLMICVKDPLGWHAENMLRQPEHYSALRLFGPRWIMKYQEELAANVYFNTLVSLPDIGIKIKYGVISYEHLLNDLHNWKHLYVAGRLHKPVHHVVEPDHDECLCSALTLNKRSALQVSLLLLPEKFSAYTLFCTISNLSYRGDFRMIFGESKNKVDNIVKAQLENFYEIYETSMMLLNKYVAIYKPHDGKQTIEFEQDKSAAANEYHLQQIPAELRKRLMRNSGFKGTYTDVISRLASSKTLTDVLQASVNDIVWRSSITQSLKNIPSAGILKSLQYGYRKAMKTFGI